MIYRELKIGDARVQTYVLSNFHDLRPERRRAMMVICPGGGYQFCSNREAEAVAIRFNSLGMNAVVVYYTVNPKDNYDENGIFPRPQNELADVVKWVRENADELNTDPNKVAVLGFSAGGHLAASLGVFWPEYGRQCRPDALVLCYPVITSGPLAHRGSIDSLIGKRQNLLEKVSLERQVSDKTPPTFIWTTRTDGSVPYENSVMFKEALEGKGVKCGFHLYAEGAHGLSLGSEEVMRPGMQAVRDIQDWPERARDFLVEVFGSLF